MTFKNIVSSCDADTFRCVVDSCMNSMCGRGNVDTYKDLALPKEDLKLLSDSIKLGIEACVKYSLIESQIIPSDEWAEVDRKYIDIIQDCLKRRKADTSQIKLSLLLSKNGLHVKDYDWNVKLILGSNSLSSLEEPLTNVQLFLTDDTTHSIELNKKEISKLINNLEKLSNEHKSQH